MEQEGVNRIAVSSKSHSHGDVVQEARDTCQQPKEPTKLRTEGSGHNNKEKDFVTATVEVENN